MPRQFGKVDLSVKWDCRCGHKHAPAAPCPRPGDWLVLALCRNCNPKTGRYCTRHRNRNEPDDPTPPAMPADELAATLEEERRRIGGDA